MATDRTILRLGKSDEGRFVSSEDFAEAEFDAPWRYEREDGRLIVMAPSGEGHFKATSPWRDRLILFFYANPGVIDKIATEAWIRVHDGTDRIGDIGVYLPGNRAVSEIPDRVPEMMFEIVSPGRTSRDRDYLKKRAEYRALGVLEYVIIDRFQKMVTVFRFAPNADNERTLSVGEVYESPLLPGFSVRLSEVF
jgi:Uma2 family endonuclease